MRRWERSAAPAETTTDVDPENEAQWLDEPRPYFDSDEPSQNGRVSLEQQAVEQAQPFPGLTHAQVLALEHQDADDLITDLIEKGVVGTIAGVPESHKSWLSHAVAVGAAAGTGTILGHPVACSTTVGYFWQDDSRRNEVDRIQTYERVHQSPPELSLWWYLNEGLELPRDLHRLRATILERQLGLVILDSFYNVASADLKDEGAGDIIKQLKQHVCDTTGCTILIVDHMPWATDTNRLRLRAYGSVIKSAAARFHILIDAEKDKLWIEARGNNIKGFKRTPAVWDADQLELRLLEHTEIADDEYAQRILDYLVDNPWALTRELEEDVEGKSSRLRLARQHLEDEGRVIKRSSRDLGRPGTGMRWNSPNQAGLSPVPDPGTSWDEQSSQAIQNEHVVPRPTPYRGDDGDDVVRTPTTDKQNKPADTPATTHDEIPF